MEYAIDRLAERFVEDVAFAEVALHQPYLSRVRYVVESAIDEHQMVALSGRL
jgi:hypothetical protein